MLLGWSPCGVLCSKHHLQEQPGICVPASGGFLGFASGDYNSVDSLWWLWIPLTACFCVLAVVACFGFWLHRFHPATVSALLLIFCIS